MEESSQASHQTGHWFSDSVFLEDGDCVGVPLCSRLTTCWECEILKG